MILFTAESKNIKTGPIPVSGSSSATCPSVCPFKKQGCYAKYGPISWHWQRVTEGKIGIVWKDFLNKVKALANNTLWRHNQFGDLAGIGNKINVKQLGELVEANKGKRGFTYTHKPVIREAGVSILTLYTNRAAIRLANKNGFTVNLSGNNLAHADKLKALKIGPVVSVVSDDTPNTSYTPAGHKVIVCPAQQRDDVTCSTCKLCSVASRSVIIGFKPHGMGAKYVRKIAA